PPPRSTPFPYTTLFRSPGDRARGPVAAGVRPPGRGRLRPQPQPEQPAPDRAGAAHPPRRVRLPAGRVLRQVREAHPELAGGHPRSEEHTSELQSLAYLV